MQRQSHELLQQRNPVSLTMVCRQHVSFCKHSLSLSGHMSIQRLHVNKETDFVIPSVHSGTLDFNLSEGGQSPQWNYILQFILRCSTVTVRLLFQSYTVAGCSFRWLTLAFFHRSTGVFCWAGTVRWVYHTACINMEIVSKMLLVGF